jgi:hypothetical protein
MPNQPNGAKALQERANARPIPTYKVGGSVKKSPPQPTAAEREADRKRREELAKSKVTQSEADTLGRAMRSEGPRYKMGGKAMAPPPPPKIPKTGKKIPVSPPDIARPLSSDEQERRYDAERRKMLNEASKAGFERSPGYKMGGKVQTSADTAKKLATEMGGMKKGGKPKKDGLAVMIAIGSPMKGMKKPVKKMGGGMMYAEGGAMEPMSSGPSYFQHHGEEKRDKRKLDRRAEGGAMKPVKKAAGGAAKVRKGMMTPEGVITHAMNKVRGK